MIVTEIVLADDDISDGYNSYDDDEDEGDEYEGEEGNNFHEEKIQDDGDGKNNDEYTDEEDVEEEDEDEYEQKKESAFSAFGAFSDDSSSSSSSSDEDSDGDDTTNLDEEGDEECCDVPSSTYNCEEDAAACVEDCVEKDCIDDDLDLLEDIIYQNRLQARFYPDDDDDDDDDAGNEAKPSANALAPIAFDDGQYDPDNFDVDRLAAIQHRLQKRYGSIYCCHLLLLLPQ